MKSRKVISILLTLILLVGLVPTFSLTAFAAEVTNVAYIDANDKLTGLPVPARTGYTFGGRYDGDTQVDINTIFGSDTIITAKLEEGTQHTVTFMVDGVEYATQTVKHGELATAPTVPTKEGYDFERWSPYIDLQHITEDTIFTAIWKVKTHMVTFYGAGEGVYHTQTVEHGKYATPPADPVKDGYKFIRWIPDINTPITKETDFVPAWAKIITITYMTDENTVFTTQTYNLGNTIYPPTPTREGYTFKGWTPQVAEIASIDAIHTAQWERKTYTVTYDVHGGTPVPKNQTINHGEKLAKPTDPTMDGYTFDGWYKEESCTNVWNFETDTVTKYTTLHAKWIANATYYSLYLSGGMVRENNSTGNILTDTGITYVNGEYVFTDVVFSTTAQYAVDVGDSTATIRIVGANLIESTHDSGFGLRAKNLTIDGTGSLTATGKSNGIFAGGGTLSIIDGTVTGTGGARGFFVNYGNMSVTGGVVTGSGSDHGIYLSSGTLTIEGGVVTGTAGSRGILSISPSITGMDVYSGNDEGSAGKISNWNGTNGGKYMRLQEKSKFTVTFNAGNSVTAPEAQTVIDGKKATEPATAPTKEGYTFGGWYKEATCTNVWDFDNDTVSGNITLYAKWEVSAYALYLSDGTVREDSSTGDILTNTGITYVNGEYVFNDVNFSTAAINAVVIGDSSATIRLEGNNTIKTTDTDGTALLSLNSTMLKVTGTGSLTAIGGVIGISVKGSMTVEGNVTGTGSGYGIHVDSGTLSITGGTVIGNGTAYYGIYVSDGNLSVSGGKVIGEGDYYGILASTTFAVTGMDVYSGDNADNAGEIDNWDGGNGGKYMRLQEKRKFTVTFNAGNSVTTPEAQTVIDGEKATEPAAPTKNGYVLVGWYKEESGTNVWDFDNDIVTADITLYAVWTLPPHTHCLCGGNTNIGDHTNHENKIFTAWTNATALPTEAGNYYLTTDVTFHDTSNGWRPDDGTVLCLNGHSITNTGGKRAIQLKDVALTLCDCTENHGVISVTKTGENKKSDGAIGVEEGGTLYMYGGTISGNTGTNPDGNSDYTGGGVEVVASGTFKMYGGKITGNTIKTGGGVYNNGTFYMYGGEISGNTATYHDGGGVYNMGTFEMSGGTISGNKSRYGAGVYTTGANSALTISGGAIRGNIATSGSTTLGGGVFVGYDVTNASFGDVTITENSAEYGGGIFTEANNITFSGKLIVTGNTSSEGAPNVYLGTTTEGQHSYITIGEMDADASVGIQIDWGRNHPLLFSSGGSAYAERFTSDEENYKVTADGDNLKLTLADLAVTDDVTNKKITVTFPSGDITGSPVIIMAFYENPGKMLTMQMKDYTGKALDFDTDFTHDYVKVMAWESVTSLKPICEAVTHINTQK